MKKYKGFIVIAIITICIVLVAIYISPNNSKKTNIIKKDFKSIDILAGDQIYTYEDYLYIYGNTRLKIMKNDNLLFEDNFSLESPYIVTSYDKLAIADKNSKIIKVYSKDGLLYTINSSYNILGFTINKNGFLAIIVKNEENYQIELYSNKGENIAYIKDITYASGIPVGISISEDNKVLAVSYIKTNSATIDSNISFYTTQDAQAFGGFTKYNQIAGIIKFVDNSNIVCISDKEIFLIKVNSTQNNEQTKEIYTKPLNNILKYVKFLDGIGYMVCYGEAILKNEDTIEENTIVFYNNSGGETGKYLAKNQNTNITNICANKYGAIVGNGRLFIGLNPSGNKLWQYQATQDIKNVLFYQNANKIAISTNNQVKIVKVDKNLVDKQIDENDIDTTINDKNESIEESTEQTSTKKNNKNKNDNKDIDKQNKNTEDNKTENDKNTTTNKEKEE